jgi:predicted aspartyl protease
MIGLRHVALGLALATATPLCAAVPEEPAPVPDIIDLGTDTADRMTVAVSIGGTGPYPFVVDTGAQRTVISAELAERLDLDSGRTAMLHSMSEMRSVRTVIIPSIELNARAVKGIEAPALPKAALGAAGILGVDSLQSQRVLLDFKAGTMTVTPSAVRVEPWDGKTIVVKARSRFGQLILADVRVGDEKVWAIVDTGAQVSVGNEALRRRLFGPRARKAMKPVALISITGGSTPATYTTADEISIGGVTITNMPIAFADAQPFRTLNLTRRPALLLGMDALRLFERVSVDFANRKIRFLSPDGASRATEAQLAEGEPSAPPGA